MQALNGTFRTALPGLGSLGPDISQGFTLGYFLSLPPGGAQSVQSRIRYNHELCEAAGGCYSGQAKTQPASEA